MEFKENKQPDDKEKMLKNAKAWQKRLLDRVNILLNAKEADRNSLIDVLWNSGILDRIAPVNPEEKESRIKLGKKIWRGDRDDPELYWRILYAAAAAKEAIERGWSVVSGSGGYIIGFFQGANEVIFSERNKDFFPETNDKMLHANPYLILTESIIERARVELEKRGIKPHQKFPRYGARGKWKGVDVKIDRFSDDGLVWLKGIDINAHNKLYELSKGGGILPSEINPDDFESSAVVKK